MTDHFEDCSDAAPSPSIVAVWFALGVAASERVPWWSAQWLTDGHDGPALRELAGLNGRDPHAVNDLLPAVMAEMGVEIPSTIVAAVSEELRHAAELHLSGQASARWVAQHVEEIVPRAGYADEVLDLPLGQLYGVEDEWEGRWGRPADELKAFIRAKCLEQLQGGSETFRASRGRADGLDSQEAADDRTRAARDLACHDRLGHVEHVFINFKNGTFQWVDIQRFRLADETDDDAILLAALISQPLFGDNHAGGDPGDNPERHGPYWRELITPASYEPIGASDAEQHLGHWAEQHAPLPEDRLADLERQVYRPLHTAERIYRLRDLSPDTYHDWGGVHGEFHELELIDRRNKTLSLIVAADD